MDDTQINLTHHKTRWIIIFIACLIVLVAAVMALTGKEDEVVSPSEATPQTFSEQDLIQAMTAGPSTLSNAEIKTVLEASSVNPNSSGSMTNEEKQELIDAMSSQ